MRVFSKAAFLASDDAHRYSELKQFVDENDGKEVYQCKSGAWHIEGVAWVKEEWTKEV